MLRNKSIMKMFCIYLAFFALLEAGSRIWLRYFATPLQQESYISYTGMSPEKYKWTRHHYLNYYPNPNYKKDFIFHNSLGYRGKEFPIKKSKGVYRIVVLGGSSTYDTAIKDNAKTFTTQLEKILREQYDYKDIEVINAGAAGYSSWESLINLQFRVLDIEPDLVIVYHGVNDVHARLVLPSAYQGDNSGRVKQWQKPKILFWEYSCFLRILSRKLGISHQVGLDTFVCASTAFNYPWTGYPQDYILEVVEKNPPVFFRRNLDNMIAISEQHGVKIMLTTWVSSPYFDDNIPRLVYQQGLKENNDVVKETAEAHDVPLFDFAAIMPKDKEYWYDGRHNNARGARRKAELFAEFIHKNDLIPKKANKLK